MSSLTPKEYWERIYREKLFKYVDNSIISYRKASLKSLTKKIKIFNSYSDNLIWENIYKRFLPKNQNLKVLEIGSAPGFFLIRLKKNFGYIPFGVEYSKNGYEINQKIFKMSKINPNNVIHSDFFSNDFQDQYNEKFDIVFSRGFIEHFTNPKEIIIKHKKVMKKYGILIVKIPNFQGINYILQLFFNKDTLNKHNLNIMVKENFLELFKENGFKKLYCNFCGTFNIGLINIKKNSHKKCFFNVFNLIQIIFNFVFNLAFKKMGIESKYFSPYLIFIGIKRK